MLINKVFSSDEFFPPLNDGECSSLLLVRFYLSKLLPTEEEWSDCEMFILYDNNLGFQNCFLFLSLSLSLSLSLCLSHLGFVHFEFVPTKTLFRVGPVTQLGQSDLVRPRGREDGEGQSKTFSCVTILCRINRTVFDGRCHPPTHTHTHTYTRARTSDPNI